MPYGAKKDMAMGKKAAGMANKPAGKGKPSAPGKRAATTVKKSAYTGTGSYGKYVSGTKSATGKAMSAAKRKNGR